MLHQMSKMHFFLFFTLAKPAGLFVFSSFLGFSLNKRLKLHDSPCLAVKVEAAHDKC